jgi:hypothetical protein
VSRREPAQSENMRLSSPQLSAGNVFRVNQARVAIVQTNNLAEAVCFKLHSEELSPPAPAAIVPPLRQVLSKAKLFVCVRSGLVQRVRYRVKGGAARDASD